MTMGFCFYILPQISIHYFVNLNDFCLALNKTTFWSLQDFRYWHTNIYTGFINGVKFREPNNILKENTVSANLFCDSPSKDNVDSCIINSHLYVTSVFQSNVLRIRLCVRNRSINLFVILLRATQPTYLLVGNLGIHLKSNLQASLSPSVVHIEFKD